MIDLTLPEILQNAATVYPDKGISYLSDDGNLTFQAYSDLLTKAERFATGLNRIGIKAGEKLIIATDLNQETIISLWGCFLAGVIPTVLQTPISFSDNSLTTTKLLNVFNLLNKPILIISKPISGENTDIQHNTRYFADIGSDEKYCPVSINPSDTAFIQFSSGSTGDPKGIMLSHRNLMYNMNSIAIGLQLTHDHRTGNWMPLFHDMGLIGYHLTPIYFTHNQYHIETTDFIKNPSLWLDLMSTCRINVTGCPNFGQALVLRHLKRKNNIPDWDFSNMKALLNGAEPISVKIMEEFVESVRRFNFPEEAMMPVYGMAEATLAISFTPIMQPSVVKNFDIEALDRHQTAKPVEEKSTKHSRKITAVGYPLDKVKIRITDDNDIEVKEGQVGHIQVSGPAVTTGYFGNPEATSKAFCGEWLRTGDIGFHFEGMLYISGRHKDIIFMNGRNYFAHDLENLALTMDGLSYGKVIFGGITDPKTSKEKVLAFVAGTPETKAMETLSQLRALLRKKLGIHLDELILIRSNEIPKTSSGKIQRYRLIQRYQQGEFKDSRIK